MTTSHHISWKADTLIRHFVIINSKCKFYDRNHESYLVFLLQCLYIYGVTSDKSWQMNPFRLYFKGFKDFKSHVTSQRWGAFLGHNALCSYPHVKASFRDFSQTLTMAPIFQQSHYFRQKIWVNIWIQFHFLFCF